MQMCHYFVRGGGGGVACMSGGRPELSLSDKRKMVTMKHAINWKLLEQAASLSTVK